jgi:hypothetical protein
MISIGIRGYERVVELVSVGVRVVGEGCLYS